MSNAENKPKKNEMINISSWNYQTLSSHVKDNIEIVSRNYNYDKLLMIKAGWNIINPDKLSEQALREWLVKHFPTNYYIN